MKRNWISFFLALCLVLTLVPLSAMADEIQEERETAEEEAGMLFDVTSEESEEAAETELAEETAEVPDTGAADHDFAILMAASYEIATVADLKNIKNDLSGTYTLVQDLDLSTSGEWIPIGGNNMGAFRGVFDGQGHTINGLKMSGVNSYTYSGLFGEVSAGTIRNLNVSGTITGGRTAGMLAGFLSGGTVEFCSSTGSVKGDTNIGGLIGKSKGSTIRNCYSRAEAINTSGNSSYGCGGLVGQFSSDSANPAMTVINSYAAGLVQAAGSAHYGGIVGRNVCLLKMASCFYDTTTTGKADEYLGVGLKPAAMKEQSTYSGWDFENTWGISADQNDGYPYLKLTGEYQPLSPEGAGTQRVPYIITTEEELAAIARGEIRNSFSSYYELANDIVLTRRNWTPIGGNGMDVFSGVFDGKGHTISGIDIAFPAYGNSGLFGEVSGTIRNLNVSGTITDAGTAGMLAGYLDDGTVEFCSSAGSVKGQWDVGGLIGSSGYGIIRNCYSRTGVTNTSNGSCGGLVGWLYEDDDSSAALTNSYATGLVVSTDNALCGGITGVVEGSPAIISCFYDTTTTKMGDEYRGFGLKTAAMKQQASYSGWDFENTWGISADQNDGYPYLKLTGAYQPVSPKGSGTERAPYLISTEEELAAIARGEVKNSFSSCYELANDIVLTRSNWSPISGNGMDAFSGVFDGKGHTISGLNIAFPAFVWSGLFGEVTGTIRNLNVSGTIENAIVAGMLAGSLSDGTVEYCSSTGSVKGHEDVGGLIGYSDGGKIQNCYSRAEVTSTWDDSNSECGSGGLLGKEYNGSVFNSYATGNVLATDLATYGGIVGCLEQNATITNCYYDNCDSDEGFYRTMAEMKQESTYSEWDFETVWHIQSSVNDGYPYLWETAEAVPVAVTGVSLNKASLTLNAGETEKLTATVSPTNATNQSVTWKSSDDSVASVSTYGTVTAKLEGIAMITVTTADGGYSDSCTVTVTGEKIVEENGPRIIVEKGEGLCGDTVNIEVSLEENPGIVSMLLNVSYDSSVLTLTEVRDAGKLGQGMHNPDLTRNPYILSWADDTADKNYLVNGTLVTLTFQIDDSAAAGEYPITVSYDNDQEAIMDVDFHPVNFAVAQGSVTVYEILYGDVNRDGKVSAIDRAYIARYLASWPGYSVNDLDMKAADVSGDGKVTASDRMILARHLAKWEGYKTLPYKKS